jgi:hypothetical protein
MAGGVGANEQAARATGVPGQSREQPRRANCPPNVTQELAMRSQSHTRPTPSSKQRQDLLDSERQANQDEPRNFKDDALTDKRVEVEPDGTGPTSTKTFDAPEDRARKSGNTENKDTTRP